MLIPKTSTIILDTRNIDFICKNFWLSLYQSDIGILNHLEVVRYMFLELVANTAVSCIDSNNVSFFKTTKGLLTFDNNRILQSDLIDDINSLLESIVDEDLNDSETVDFYDYSTEQFAASEIILLYCKSLYNQIVKINTTNPDYELEYIELLPIGQEVIDPITSFDEFLDPKRSTYLVRIHLSLRI